MEAKVIVRPLHRNLSVWGALALSVALLGPSMAANINPQAPAGHVGRARFGSQFEVCTCWSSNGHLPRGRMPRTRNLRSPLRGTEFLCILLGENVASNQRRSTRAALLAVVAAGALVVSACGSSTPAASPGSSTAGGPASSGAASSVPAAPGSASSGSASSGTKATASSAFVAPSTAAPASLTPAILAAAKATLTDSSSLTVCTSLPYPPFEVDDGSGKVIGFDIDFMDWMSKNLGVTTKVSAQQFTAIKSGQAMKSKKCDIAAAAMTITPEREKAISFSNSYYDASQALMVLSAKTAKSLSDLKGKKLGAQTGTTGLSYAQKYADQYGYTVLQYQQISDEEQALQSGKIDAAIHDQPALNDYSKQQKGKVKIVDNFNTGEEYGFGAALGNTALVQVANYAIAQSHKDGTYLSSYKKWIGGTPPTK